MLTISYMNREEETAASYDDAVATLKERFRYAEFSKAWEPFGADYERQLVWAKPADAACDVIGFRAVAQIVRPLTVEAPTRGSKAGPSAKATKKKARRKEI